MSDAEKPQSELEQLRRAMETRPVIDQARGVLITAFGLTPQQAWEVMVAASQNTNIKLYRVAEQIVTSTQGEPLPEVIREAIGSALKGPGKPPA